MIKTSSRPRVSSETLILLSPALLLFAFAYVLPLLDMAVASAHRGESLSAGNYSELLSSPTFGVIVWRTVHVAAVVSAICLICGYPMAYALARLSGPALGVALFLVTIPYLTSVLVRSYAWVVMLGSNGVLNRVLVALGVADSPLKLVYNDIGMYVGMIHIQLPLMILPLYAAFRQVDRRLPMAAQSLGSSPASAFFHTVLPLSAPGAAAGTILVFLSCIGFYVTPALLGGPGEYLIAQAIQVRVSLMADFGSASAQATLLLATVIVIAVLFRRPIANALGTEIDISKRVGTPENDVLGLRLLPSAADRLSRLLAKPLDRAGTLLSALRWPILWGWLAVGLLFLIVPMLVVVPIAFSDAAYLTFPPPSYSLRWVRAYLGNQQWIEATAFSIWISALSATFALVIGGAAALALMRTSFPGRDALHLLFISPIIVPHMVIAVALFFVLARLKLANHPVSFLIAYTLLAIPFVLLIVSAGLKRFDRSLESASATLGASPPVTLIKVTLPLLLPTLTIAFGFAFLAAFDDLVMALFFSTPRATTLPMRMWDNLREEVSPMIAVVAVLLLLTLIAAVSLSAFVRAKYFARRSFAVVPPALS